MTGRALAASAARAGRATVVLDYFADRDTRSLARDCRAVVSSRRLRFHAGALLAGARALAPPAQCAGLVYGSGFEGRTGLLARLAAGRRLYGNAPAVVAAVRDPRRFFPLLDELGIAHPPVRFTAPGNPAGWLVKDPGGAGGARVRPAGHGRNPAGWYFQHLERGHSLSALFLAGGRRAFVVGVNRQWTASGDRSPFRYGGAVGGIGLPPAVELDLRAKLDALVAATGLVGLNGLDFLLDGDRWRVLELNPRPTATLELYDPDYPQGLFAWHLRACDGELPVRPPRTRAVRAHGVVYTARPGRVASGFTFPVWCRDIPNPGTRFGRGDPLCTVHASAADAERAVALVRRRRAMMERAMLAHAA